MNHEPAPAAQDWLMADVNALLAAAFRLAAGSASERDRRLVRKHLKRDGERALWLIGQKDGDFPAADPALSGRVNPDGSALLQDLRAQVWLALTGLSRGHFGMTVVFRDPGYVEFSPTDGFGFLLLELARALARSDPSGPKLRTSRCRHCGSSIEVRRRHRNGTAVRKFCSPRCKAAAFYRDRLAEATRKDHPAR